MLGNHWIENFWQDLTAEYMYILAIGMTQQLLLFKGQLLLVYAFPWNHKLCWLTYSTIRKFGELVLMAYQ